MCIWVGVDQEGWKVGIWKGMMEAINRTAGHGTKLDLWNLPSRQWKQLKVCARGHVI